MIEIAGLQYAYGADKTFFFPDLTLAAGSNFLILGKSGIGKTTLLHLLAGLMKPQKGKIVIQGTDIYALDDKKLDYFRGQNIGVIFQQNHFVESLTVEENLWLAQHLAGKPQNKKATDELLQALNIGDKKAKYITTLSQGERQRVAIARALINTPKIILADEPTSALDDDNCQAVISLLKSQAEAVNATLIIVTHDDRLKSIMKDQLTLTNLS